METICNHHNLTLNVTNDPVYPSEAAFVVWVIVPFSFMVIVFGLPLNAPTIRVLLAKPDLRSTSNLLPLTTAISDFLFCLCFSAETVRSPGNPRRRAPYLSFGVSQLGGPLVLTFLCLDGDVAVCRPLWFLRSKSSGYRTTPCVGTGALTAAFFTSKWTIIFSGIIVSMVTTSTCNILVLCSLTNRTSGRKEIHPIKKRTFKIVLTTLVVINVQYIPTEGIFRYVSPIIFCSYPLLGYVSYLMLSLGSLSQPACYLIKTNGLTKMAD